MDINKPKPWRDMREFLKEIATIVVGVLIALGAEQTVEALHTRHMIHEAEAAMRTELADDDLQQAYARLAVTPCLENGLKRLRDAIARRPDPQQFGELALAYRPPVRTWETDAWRATLSSAAGAHMSSGRLLGWSTAFTMAPLLAANGQRETQAVERLHRARFHAGAWSDARADELNDLVDELQGLVAAMAEQSNGLRAAAAHIGVTLPVATQDTVLSQVRHAYGACAVRPNPATAFPAGQAPTREELRAFDQALGLTGG